MLDLLDLLDWLSSEVELLGSHHDLLGLLDWQGGPQSSHPGRRTVGQRGQRRELTDLPALQLSSHYSHTRGVRAQHSGGTVTGVAVHPPITDFV